jgi:NDP-sugar pyrophosphorylase family protein
MIQKYLNSGEIKLKGNISIGRNCRVERGTVIEDSHIGHTSMIERDVEIRKSMIMSFSIIKRGVNMNRSIVGRHSTIGTNSVLETDQPYTNGRIPVIGEGVILPAESRVLPGTRVAPLKYSHRVLATGRFAELGNDDRNIYFTEKIR